MSLLDPDLIRGADAGHFWLFTAGVWTVSLAGFFLGWRFFRRLQLMENTPRSLIRSAAQGYVELSGMSRLMPGDPILAPLTRMHCVWWSYRIEEYVGSGKHAHWETVNAETSGELFWLEDNTGRCVVDPEHAVVYPSTKDTWYGSSATPEGGPALGGSRFGARFRYTEQRMHAGDPLYALGFFHTQGPVSAGDIDEEVRQQLITWKKDQAWLIRHFDTDHDGQVGQQEWDAARAEARRLILEQARDNLKRPPVDVLCRPPDGREFILSTLPQQKLGARLRFYTVACLICFVCAGALGTYLVHARLAGEVTAVDHP
ncbi:MAG TPA: GIDE domain-containing protein [Trueperaceae bacterium]